MLIFDKGKAVVVMMMETKIADYHPAVRPPQDLLVYFRKG